MHLKGKGGLSESDSRFLRDQRPCGVDGEGRIVLEFASPAQVAEAPRKKRKAHTYRAGPPTQKVLYLPTFLASVTLPHSRVAGAEFQRVNGDIQMSLLAPEDPSLPYGVYPRLALVHLTTQALLKRERSFYVGESCPGCDNSRDRDAGARVRPAASRPEPYGCVRQQAVDILGRTPTEGGRSTEAHGNAFVTLPFCLHEKRVPDEFAHF